MENGQNRPWPDWEGMIRKINRRDRYDLHTKVNRKLDHYYHLAVQLEKLAKSSVQIWEELRKKPNK